MQLLTPGLTMEIDCGGSVWKPQGSCGGPSGGGGEALRMVLRNKYFYCDTQPSAKESDAKQMMT